MKASTKEFRLRLCDLSDSNLKITFSTPTADQKSPCYSISVFTPKFYATALAWPSIDTFLHEALLHKNEERRTACTDAAEPEAFIQLFKCAADSHYRTCHTPGVTSSTSNTSIEKRRIWILRPSKFAASLLLWMLWSCVTLVRAIFLLKMSGEVSGSSSIKGTKYQVNNKFFLQKYTCFKRVEVSTNLGSFLDQYVHQNCGFGLTLRYLYANLTTVVRERILGIVGGG